MLLSNIEMINKYIEKGVYPPLILMGKKGIGKRLAADYIASRILGTENIKNCMDYVLLKSENGSILLDHLDKVKHKSMYHPASGNYKVFVIDDANTMNVYSQNSLLKLIEEGSATNIFIFVAHEPLLDTIQSRCEIIFFNVPLEDEVKNYFTRNNMELDETVMKMVDCRIGLYFSMIEDKQFVNTCKNIISSFLNMKRRRELLEMFGQVNEKDNNFYEAYPKEKIIVFLNYFKSLFVDIIYEKAGVTKNNYPVNRLFSLKDCHEIINALDDHIYRMGSKAYSKNDFFDLIRTMVIK